MSNIHYFQRYSQKENWVTNNTMLLLSRLNYFNPKKFEAVINAILDNISSVNVGVRFSQQNRSNESIPDGTISQDSFQIRIETKLHDNFTENQLIRHLRGFSENSSTKILLGLSKHKVNEKMVRSVNQRIREENLGNVKFAALSFSTLIQAIRNEIDAHETEISEIIDDFQKLCEEQDLIDLSDQTMLGLTVGLSLTENLDYDMYYDPENRNHNRGFAYIGLYENKEIIAIGKLSKIVYCSLKDGKIVQPKSHVIKLSKQEEDRIKSIIEKTDYYDLTSGHKFLLVDKFYKTSFTKESPSSLRGKKYFHLPDYIDFHDKMTTQDIAIQLKNKTWS